jgi:ribosomal protein L18
MNLEKMRLGPKPAGWSLERKPRSFWNKLELEISNAHTTASVTHWSGRVVARASTQEWPIRQFLYNLTDQAALRVVGQVISQRCLETGVSEVVLLVDEEDRQKEKMVKFIAAIEESGLSLTEPDQYRAFNRHFTNPYKIPVATVEPWTVLEPEEETESKA